MQQAIGIDKKAFIARVNHLYARVVVDTRYTTVNGETKLILIYDDESEEIFTGLQRVA